MNINLTDSQLRAIGLMSVRWSYLETEIDFTVSALGSSIENDQRIPLRFKERVRRWRKLARAMYEGSALTQIEEIIDTSKKIHDARCIVLHARVYRTAREKRGQMVMETHRHLEEWHMQAVTLRVSGVLTACEDTLKCFNDLRSFNRRHLPASPRTLPRIHP